MACYVVVVTPRREVEVVANLMEEGFSAYVPTVRRWVKRGLRTIAEPQALLSRYIFITTERIVDDYHVIRHAKHVGGILGSPTPIPDAWLTALLIAECFGHYDFTQPTKPRQTRTQARKRIAHDFKQLRDLIDSDKIAA